MTIVFTGDTGTEIVLDCGADVSAASVRKILALAPNGKRHEWAAVADGTTAIKRVTLAADLDVAGSWTLQPYIEIPGWSGRGQVVTLTVEAGV